MERSEIQNAIKEITDWTETYYQSFGLGLPRDIDEKGRVSTNRLFNDFGDYIPFFAYLNTEAFCKKQIEDLRLYRRPDGMLPPEFSYAGLSCIRSYDQSDYLLGLIDLYSYYPREELRKDILRIADRIANVFFSKACSHSWFFPSINTTLPITDSKDGIFIELFLLVSEIGEKQKNRERARSIAEQIIQTAQKRNYPLLPNMTGCNALGKLFIWMKNKNESHTYTPMKYISNTLYGMLELYKADGNQQILEYIHQCHDVICSDLLSKDGFISPIMHTKGHVQKQKTHLVHNFPIIDWCADCAYFLHDDRFLKTAKTIADAWLAYADPATHLIPVHPKELITDLDTLTDFSIALYKLATVTDQRYKEYAENIIKSVLTYHRKPDKKGYILSVNTKNGDPVNSVIKIKFVCLFLKALIVAEQEGEVYERQGLFELTKDR